MRRWSCVKHCMVGPSTPFYSNQRPKTPRQRMTFSRRCINLAGCWNLYLLWIQAVLVAAATTPSKQRQQQLRSLQDPSSFAEGFEVVVPVPSNTNSTATSTVPNNGTCAPCPLQCPLPECPGGIMTQQEPLTLQILVVDSPGIITMGTWYCCLCYHQNGYLSNVLVSSSPWETLYCTPLSLLC